MKHHSLIFVISEGVPVSSLVRGAYFVHKNVGDRALFGTEASNLDLESLNWFSGYERLFGRVCRDPLKLGRRFRQKGEVLRKKDKKIEQIVRGLIPDAAGGENS
ncbi:MAG: hypothetical protein JXA62_08520 [Candidatus Aminicenantes bacterium]|nr:hypothetical protein [Candidatus Aminicenantes bacterium]